MGGKRISGAALGADQTGNRARRAAASRKPDRRPAGLAVIPRDGHFHLSGRIRIKGRSIRIRESTGLAAVADNREAADELRRQKEQEIRDAVLWGCVLPFRSRSRPRPI
jgi:hypothetical protein